MALINCPECGREVSDSAASCPGCGYGIVEALKTNNEKTATSQPDAIKPVKNKVNGCSAFILLCVILWGVYTIYSAAGGNDVSKEESYSKNSKWFQENANMTEAEAHAVLDKLLDIGISSFRSVESKGKDGNDSIYWLKDVNNTGIEVSIAVNNNKKLDFACIKQGKILFENGKLILRFTNAVK